jgi:hypothetical protein
MTIVLGPILPGRGEGLAVPSRVTTKSLAAHAGAFSTTVPTAMPSLRQPHGDHRDLRARASSSPSALRAGDRHPDQYLMTLASLPLSLPLLSHWLRPATMPHAPFLVPRRDLPRNRPAISTKSVLFLSSGAPARPNHCHPRLSPGPALHRRRQRNPVAPADRGARLPRFPSLAAFERRPGAVVRVVRSVVGPASETRHTSGREQLQHRTCTEVRLLDHLVRAGE